MPTENQSFLALAQRAVEAGLEWARERDVRMTFVVMDVTGTVCAAARMDGSRTITYDVASSLLVFNGTIEKTTPQGNVRYLFVDVWDGELPSVHAAHSYMIDLLNPSNPTP